MSDQQQASRKPRSLTATFATAVDWIAAGLLAALLVTGLTCRMFSRFGVAILALLLAHVVYCTIAATLTKGMHPPKAYRRTASALWILLLTLLAIRLFWPDGHTWKPYTFEDDLAAVGGRHAAPDVENAASLYETLWNRFELYAARRKFYDTQSGFPEGQRANGASKAEALTPLNNHLDLIPGLMKACSRELCHFPVQTLPLARAGPKPSRQCTKLKFFSNLLLVAAQRDIESGRLNDGLEKCKCVIQIAKHLFQQSTITHFLAGFCIERDALELVAGLAMANVPGEMDLRPVAECIDLENRWDEDWARIVEAEKLRAKNLCGQLYEVNAQGKIRFTRRFFSRSVSKSPGEVAPAGWKTKIGDTIAPIGLALLIPSSPETTGKIIDDMCQKRYLSADRYATCGVLEKQRKLAQMLRRLCGMRFLARFGWLETLEVSAFDRVYVYHVAKRRNCRILIALRSYRNRHGQWPARLEDIGFLVPAVAFTDPISGRDFRYQLTSDGFKLHKQKVGPRAGYGKRS
ncbi:MAG: hypothetical protein JSU70_05070 [Phycisphaerales bacterium]|nr:MAG: hypothetical protein JSU70_05070 [Phycisphaerales bacterium]